MHSQVLWGSVLFSLRSGIRVSQIGDTIPGSTHKAILTAFHLPSFSNGQFFLPLAIVSAFLQFSYGIGGKNQIEPDRVFTVLCHLFTAWDEERAKRRYMLLHLGQSKHRQHWGSNFRANYTSLAAKLQPHLDGNRVVGCAVREHQSVIGADCSPHCALPS